MTKTCSQCGTILRSELDACEFCDPSDSGDNTRTFESRTPVQGNLALREFPRDEWRGQLSERVHAYRVRKRKQTHGDDQPELPFQGAPETPAQVTLQLEEEAAPASRQIDDFSFTMAIGRSPEDEDSDDSRLIIDLTAPVGTERKASSLEEDFPALRPFFPTASLSERRSAALVDAGCLLFAYGALLALFGSLGGQFTLSKISAAVSVAAFVFVYLQYFVLFTIFGGTTPGMMVRGLHIVNYAGDVPTPRQLMLRAAGYMLSAGTLFLGFFWALWDEDTLTWHDRISGTYLSLPEESQEGIASHQAEFSQL